MKKLLTLSTTALTLLLSQFSFAESHWFVRPFIGLSQMQDISPPATDIDGLSGTANINLESGFNAGLGLGYTYNDHIAIELAWEYRSNDAKTTINDSATFSGGNYASNIFFLNGFYYLPQYRKFQPYIGGGLSWIQEVDIDLERNGIEQSYSGDGDIGYQVFIGTNYQLIKNLAWQLELRYGELDNIALVGENSPGEIYDVDYKTTTLQTGLVYQF